MSQEGGTPDAYLERGKLTQTFFTNRIATDALSELGVIYRTGAVRYSINYFRDHWILKLLPFDSLICDLFDIGHPTYDVITYEFEEQSSAFLDKDKVKNVDEAGFFTVQISQTEVEREITWTKVTFTQIIGTVGS